MRQRYNQISVRTHRELLQIIACLQSANQTEDRSATVARLCKNTPLPRETLDASISLGARIWLSVSIDSLRHVFTPGRSISWSSRQCLPDVVNNAFNPRSCSASSERLKLHKCFTAANLERIAGIKVQSTSNLADHLSLKDEDTKVMIFHQASFLELHQESKWCARASKDRNQ